MFIQFKNYKSLFDLNPIPEKLVYYFRDAILTETEVKHWLEILKLLIKFNGTYIESGLLKQVCRNYKEIIDKLIDLKIIYKDSTKKVHGDIKYYTAPNIYTIYLKHCWYYQELTQNEYYDKSFSDTEIFTFKSIQLDKQACINLVNPKKVWTVLNFGINRRAMKGKIVDRKYNFIHSIPKVCRPYLTINGDTFIETDVKNIQPLLLIILFIQLDLPYDKTYFESVVNGTFYESLFIDDKIQGRRKGRKFTYYLTNRDHIKELSYKDIFFGFKKSKSNAFINRFKEIYPITFSSIQKIDKLARDLQNLEAKITDTRFLTEPHFTIHDALFATKESVLKAWQTEVIERIKCLSKGNLILNYNNFKTNLNEKQETFLESNNQIIELSFNKKSIKQHKQHKHSNETAIKELIQQGVNKKEIITMLNISEKTFSRYSK